MNQMSEPQNNEVLDEKFVSRFKKSLIATLSLSSKELFHSNMLAWLLENHTSFAKKFLNVDQPIKIKVDREMYNYDLFVTYCSQGEVNKIIVENKVKSLPNSDQINEYFGKNKGHTGFIYLSLMGISDSFRNKHDNVRFVDYKQLSDWLAESDSLQDPYHDALVRDYRCLIDLLLVIKAVAEAPRDNKLGFMPGEEESLRSIRMFDVAQKIRYCVLAERCADVLKSSGIDNIKFPLEVGLTRSVGLLSVKLKFHNEDKKSLQHPILLGIQIQGSQYRYFVESEAASDELLPLAEALLEKSLWLGAQNKGKILKFGRNFKYTYDKIDDLSMDDVTSKVRNDIETLANNRKQIMALIPQHLMPVT